MRVKMKETLYIPVESTSISRATRYSDMECSFCVHSTHKANMKGQHAAICLELVI